MRFDETHIRNRPHPQPRALQVKGTLPCPALPGQIRAGQGYENF